VRSGKFLSNESTKKLLTPQILYKELEATNYYMGFGLEFSLWKDGSIRFIQKDGGNDGVTSLATYYPESDISITILINKNRDEIGMRNEIIGLFTNDI